MFVWESNNAINYVSFGRWIFRFSNYIYRFTISGVLAKFMVNFFSIRKIFHKKFFIPLICLYSHFHEILIGRMHSKVIQLYLAMKSHSEKIRWIIETNMLCIFKQQLTLRSSFIFCLWPKPMCAMCVCTD